MLDGKACEEFNVINDGLTLGSKLTLVFLHMSKHEELFKYV